MKDRNTVELRFNQAYHQSSTWGFGTAYNRVRGIIPIDYKEKLDNFINNIDKTAKLEDNETVYVSPISELPSYKLKNYIQENKFNITTARKFDKLDTIIISGTDSSEKIDGIKQITYISPTQFSVNSTIKIAGTKGGVSLKNNVENSTNEEAKNRIYYSKYQQPEAVPILNYIDVGAKDKEILGHSDRSIRIFQ